MKKLLFVLTCLFCFTGSAFAEPWIVSDSNPDLSENAVFKIELNGVELTGVHPCVNKAIKWDVQNLEGIKSIRAAYGEPWEGLGETYKWSEWSSPFEYSYPVKPSAPAEMRLSN